MTTATITNPKNGKEYILTIHNGKAAGCSCNQKKALEKYSLFAACMHMKDYNNTPKPVVVVEQDQFPTLDSCEHCGALIAKGTGVCYKHG